MIIIITVQHVIMMKFDVYLPLLLAAFAVTVHRSFAFTSLYVSVCLYCIFAGLFFHFSRSESLLSPSAVIIQCNSVEMIKRSEFFSVVVSHSISFGTERWFYHLRNRTKLLYTHTGERTHELLHWTLRTTWFVYSSWYRQVHKYWYEVELLRQCAEMCNSNFGKCRNQVNIAPCNLQNVDTRSAHQVYCQPLFSIFPLARLDSQTEAERRCYSVHHVSCLVRYFAVGEDFNFKSRYYVYKCCQDDQCISASIAICIVIHAPNIVLYRFKVKKKMKNAKTQQLNIARTQKRRIYYVCIVFSVLQ